LRVLWTSVGLKVKGNIMPSAALLSLASNDAVKQIVIRYGFSKGLVQRFIAGETLEAALLATCRLQEQGLSVALDELGENGFTKRAERPLALATGM